MRLVALLDMVRRPVNLGVHRLAYHFVCQS